MSFTDTFSVNYTQSPGAAPVFSGSITLTGGNQENVDIAGNAGPGVLTNSICAVTKSKLLSLLLVCDQNITLYTNSSSAPQDTLNISANIPYYWSINIATIFTCPFSNNVTEVFVNNQSNVACNFKLRTVQNN